MKAIIEIQNAAAVRRRKLLKRALPIAAYLSLALASAAGHAQKKPGVACVSPQKAGEGENQYGRQQAAAGGGNVQPQKAGEGENQYGRQNAGEGENQYGRQQAGAALPPCEP
jgi:hypothetical protein